MNKDQLRSYTNIKREREQIEDQLATIEAELYSPKIQQLSGMPAGPVKEGNAQEGLIVKHIELLQHYEALQARLAAELLAIEKAIEALPSRERQLVRLHYIQGLTWMQVAEEMKYSWSQIHRIHAEALRLLRDAEEGENNGKSC